MLKKITSIRDIEAIEKGDSIFNTPDPALGKKYQVNRRVGDDLIVIYFDGVTETKLLTMREMLNENWWVAQ